MVSDVYIYDQYHFAVERPKNRPTQWALLASIGRKLLYLIIIIQIVWILKPSIELFQLKTKVFSPKRMKRIAFFLQSSQSWINVRILSVQNLRQMSLPGNLDHSDSSALSFIFQSPRCTTLKLALKDTQSSWFLRFGLSLFIFLCNSVVVCITLKLSKFKMLKYGEKLLPTSHM